MRKVFLKLDGIKGESRSAGHAGEIEVSSFYWGGKQSPSSAGHAHGRAVTNNLTVIKRADRSSLMLKAASRTGQSFQGILTLEDFSARGSVIRSIVFALESVSVDSVTGIEAGEVMALSCKRIKLLRSSKGKIEDEKVGERKEEREKEITIMKRNLVIISIFLVVLALCSMAVSAQFTVKLPNIKINKPDKDTTKKTDPNTTVKTNNVKTNNVKTNNGLIYQLQLPTNVPVFLKNSIHVSTVVHDEFWKMKGQRDYSSWVPKMRFSQYYNNETELNYGVEYFNPDGSLWYSEKLESSGRNAERTVIYESPSPYANGVLDSKSTNGTGVYGFKITNLETKEVLIQGKFKVGKFSRSYSERDKNKMDFYVDHDWIMPYATIGFHHAIDEAGAMRIETSLWLKGDLNVSDLEGRVFYKGRQIASTKDQDGGGAGIVEERTSGFAAAFQQADKIWKRYQFEWENFRFDNNGSYNPEYFPRALFADKNPGEYTVKIYLSGAQVREFALTVGADGRFVTPAYSSQIPLPYYRFVVPVKFTGTGEKWNAAAWKTESFYGNPLNGFAVQ